MWAAGASDILVMYQADNAVMMYHADNDIMMSMYGIIGPSSASPSRIRMDEAQSYCWQLGLAPVDLDLTRLRGYCSHS